MKLLVSWMNELSRYVSREFYFIMQDLIRVHGWKHLEPRVLGQREGSATALLLAEFGEIPEVILFWEAYDVCVDIVPELRQSGCHTCIFADDLHQLWGNESARGLKARAFTLCDRILASYAYVFREFYPEVSERCVVWTPHSASPDFVLPFNEEPEDTILLSGAGGPHYPLRGKMKDLQETGRYPIAHRDHPGYEASYDYERDERVGPGYARTIHHYRAAFTDAATFRYVVAKHFEIPATGALLLTDGAVKEELRQLGFLEDVHYVAVTAENLEERMHSVLDPSRRAEIDAIRRCGQELVLSRHMTSHRARLIDDACMLDTVAKV